MEGSLCQQQLYTGRTRRCRKNFPGSTSRGPGWFRPILSLPEGRGVISMSQDVWALPWPPTIPIGLKSYSFAWYIGFWAPSHKGKNDFIRDRSIDCVGWRKRSSCLRNQKIDLGFQSFCWKGGKLDLGPMAQTRRKMERKRWVRTCKHTPG